MIVYSWYELVLDVTTPFPGLPDAAFIAELLLLVAGVWRYPTRMLRRWSQVRQVIESCLVMVSVLLAGWVISIRAVYQAADKDWFSLAVALAYPCGDVLIVTVLVLLLRQAPVGGRTPLLFVLLGMFMLVTADTVYALAAVDGTYYTGHWIDPGWWAGFSMISIGAYRYENDDNSRGEDRLNLGSVLAPYAVALVALVIVAARLASGNGLGPLALVLALAVVALLAASQSAAALDSVRLADEMRTQALHDPLTGLANRLLLADRIELSFRRRVRGTTTLLYIDLDDFKSINDVHGHPFGDRYLIETANRLKANARPGDTVARLGGDEFAVLLDDGAPRSRDVPGMLRRFREVLSEPVPVHGTTVPCSASIGADTVTASGVFPGAEAFMRNADVAMYVAKRAGKNRVVRFEQRMYDEVLQQSNLNGELSRAVRGNELLVHYDPIVDLRSHQVIAVEALLRWEHPTRGLLAAGDFLPAAERLGLVPAITRYVLVETCGWAAEHLSTHPNAPVGVAVNIPASEMSKSTTADMVFGALEDSRLPPTLLSLEVRGSSVLDDLVASRGMVEAFRARGIRIAVDRFGTGYSSIERLKHLPVDSVKIDRTFMDGLGNNLDDTVVVKAILKLVATMSLTSVAEGVENEVQLRVLSDLGCDSAQGCVIAQPASRAAGIPRGIPARLDRILGPVGTDRTTLDSAGAGGAG